MKTLCALLFFAVSGLVQALPDAVRQNDAGWQQWGSGEMSWLGFPLYRATLWVIGEPTPELPQKVLSAPSALQLDYRRDIPRERLVQSSVDEMRRLGASEQQLQRWEPELRRVFPDVREGDSIVGVHYPEQRAVFFHQGRPTGEVRDAQFARLFFAIWLDPRSRSPSLRAALLKRPAG
ncbi:MAG: chalcone isomerase family protein [Candidatus Accumulibacter sp. UW26]|jgi:hypothetical protein